MKSCASLSLLLIAGTLIAADDPTPAPTPAPRPVVTPATRPLHVAKVEEQPPVLRLTLILDAGNDSNVLLLPDAASGTGASRDGSVMAGTEGRLDWRPWQGRQGFVKVGGVARQDNYLDAPIDTNRRFGANAIATCMNEARTLIPALAVSGNRYQLDDETVADDGFGRLSLAWRGSGSVDIVAIDAHRILYDQDALDDRSGLLWAGSVRHWFLVEDDQPNRRFELGLRGGRYGAHEDWQTYLTLRPDLTAVWRFGDNDSGSWRLTAGTGIEWRRYVEVDPAHADEERQLLWDIQGQLAYGINATSTVGPFAGFTRRLDNLDGRTYNRWLAGLRLLVTIP